MYFKFYFYSSDFEQREKEKARIEKAFKQSDKKLGQLVTGDILVVMVYMLDHAGIAISGPVTTTY